MKKKISLFMTFVILFGIIFNSCPFMRMDADAAKAGTQYTFAFPPDSPVIVIDEALVAEKGTNNFVIPDGAFSVTVSGNVDVTIVFESTVINRAEDTNSTLNGYAKNLKDAGTRLGWGNNYVPTCPFLITNKANVHASFMGRCVFAAGANGWTSSGSKVTNNQTYKGGYAGIQVDSGSSLTIDTTADFNGEKGELLAYGGYQFFHQNGNTDPLLFNPILNPNGMQSYSRPSGTTEGENGGGAGIGGGVSYNTQTINSVNYTAGTPGEIIINSGDITAVGGHQSAGIGGGVNSAGTSKQIVINGGNVKAIGGRWASAIGDGDSNSAETSNVFANEHRIIINGGNVEAYAGVAASAIGTTDKISFKGTETGVTHGLSIAINGGKIIAHSGEADTDKPKDPNIATAAIGAGQDTDMHDNSITIDAKAQIQAVSFSQYAISNYGTDASKKPTVNIDPDGYMYLARFTSDEVFTIDNIRTFECYMVKADSSGNPMLVEANTDEMMNPDFQNNYQGEFYALNRDNNKYYLVNADGTAAAAPAGMDGETNQGKFYPTDIPNLSYYFDVGKVIVEHDVPAKYKAIATTLPDPTMVGVSGTYILHVPDAALNGGPTGFSDDIYAVIQKPTPGTTSGEILPNNDSQGNIIQHHVDQGKNGNTPENSNIDEDDVAIPFLDLQAFAGDNVDLIAKYNGDFYPTVFGYTIYLPRDTNSFTFNFKYENKNVEGIRISADANIIGKNGTTIIGKDKLLSGGTENSGYITHHLEATISSDETEIWIKKTDHATTGSGAISVIYKITVLKKPLYELGFDDMSKIYDGTRKDATVNAMFKRGTGFSDPVIKDLDSQDVATSYAIDPEAKTYPVVIRKQENLVFNAGGLVSHSETLTIVHKFTMINVNKDGTPKDGKSRIVTIVKYGNKSVEVQTDVDFDKKELGPITMTKPSSTQYFEVVQNIDTVNKIATITLKSDRRIDPQNYEILRVSFGPSTEDNAPQQGEQTIEEQINAKVEEMKQEMRNSHSNSASKVVSVNDTTVTTIPLIISIKDNNNAEVENQTKTLTKTTTIKHSKLVTLHCNYDEDHTEELKNIPTDSIILKYYENPVVGPDGKITGGTELTGAPKDAGKYGVEATIIAHGYEAYGVHTFEISKREIRPIAVEKWRKYLESNELNLGNRLDITNPGRIIFENVVTGENIKITPENYSCYYYEGGSTLTISFGNTKITIEKINIDNDATGKNYYFPEANKDGMGYTFKVPGELAYTMDEAIFRKEDGTDVWDKFWPTTETTPLDFSEGAGDDRIDYHSPSNEQHREYVYLYSVNSGTTAKKYSVDLEFGAMYFTYSKTVWNVNTHTYDDTIGGVWTGNDGINNKVTVYNRSNAPVYYSANISLDSYFGRGCLATLKTDVSTIEKDTQEIPVPALPSTPVEAVSAGDTEAKSSYFYLCMYGVPQVSSQEGGKPTGILTVTLSMDPITS